MLPCVLMSCSNLFMNRLVVDLHGLTSNTAISSAWGATLLLPLLLPFPFMMTDVPVEGTMRVAPRNCDLLREV